MTKKYISGFLYPGILLLIFCVYDFINVFINKQKIDRSIWEHIPVLILACAMISQSLLFWVTRKTSTILFILLVIIQLPLICASSNILQLISNAILVVMSIHFIYKNSKELLHTKWFPVLYIHFTFHKEYEWFIQLIKYYFNKGKYRKIISLTNSFYAYLSETQCKYYYGLSKIMINEYADGERYLNEIELTDNKFNDIYYYLGLSAYKQHNFEVAISRFSSYLIHYPDNINALHFRAYMNSQIGYFDLAIQDYTVIINMNPNAGGFYFSRGLCYKKKGDLINSKQDWLSAANCTPPDEWALVRLSEIEKENHNPKLALEYLKRAYKIDRTIKSECSILLKELLLSNKNITTAST